MAQVRQQSHFSTKQIKMKFAILFAFCVSTITGQLYFDAERDTIFELYTLKNPTNFQVIKINDQASLAASNFNPNVPTRFLIHGSYEDGIESRTTQLPLKNYMMVGDFNVIAVDWGKGSKVISAITAETYTQDVGKVTNKFINFLIANGAKMEDMLVAGHSAGAAAAQYTGAHSKGAIPVIILLDPPNYYNYKLSDAKYIEAIHSAGNMRHTALAHADFYPNGGKDQPGCPNYLISTCAHFRAVEYWAESISSSEGFWARKCSSYSSVSSSGCTVGGEPRKHGGEPTETVHGIHWFKTNSAPPFALGKNGQ